MIDIEQIKRDYIEVYFKQLNSDLLKKKKYNLKEEKIRVPIERLGTNNNHIFISKPFEALIFLVRPKFFYELFEKYGYDLFIENVRNPIHESEVNKKIRSTLAENPSLFWYFNNGVTAITSHIPKRSKQAKEFEVKGFQIINDAQTVYSIYSEYSKASDKEKLDNEVLITLKLYKSGGKDFDKNVTRYTNAQNPMKDRDFFAHDPFQIQIQNESFNTNFWYERRGDEFVKVPNGIAILPNYLLAKDYLCFHYQIPYLVKQDLESSAEEGTGLIFISRKESAKEGFYEWIFNENTRFLDLLASSIVR